jgi:hypothetical protein
MRLAWAGAIGVATVRGAPAAASAASVCPTAAAADAKPLYLPVGVGGLMRLELSPRVPGGLGTVRVAREEVASLCVEGFDVRPLDVDALPDALSIVRRGGTRLRERLERRRDAERRSNPVAAFPH